MKKQLLLLVMMLLPMVASAITAEIDGINYNLVSKLKTAEVISSINFSNFTHNYVGSITIPESVTYNDEVYNVTSIGERAFSYCDALTSVVMGNNITNIGERAFECCSALVSVTIGNSVTSIGGEAFLDCTGLEKVIAPNIAGWCNINFTDDSSNPLFYAKHLYSDENTEITNLIIPNSVTSIGDYTFLNCSGLTSVIIPNSVTSIGFDAFENCSGLTSVTIGDNVTSIGNSAFSGCSGLTSVTIGNSVTTIGNNAFESCIGLTSVTIPNSVTSIGIDAFVWCSGLTSVTIGNSVTSIGIYAFWGCSGLTSVTIPNSVINIEGGAFQDCSSLTSVTIPNSVTSIGWCAFQGCSNITSVTIGNSIQNIGSLAFGDCPELDDVTCYAESMPNTDTDSFKDSYIELATLHVPASLVSSYQSSEVWGTFGSIVPLGDYYELSITSGVHGIVTYDNQSVTDNTNVFIVNEGSDLELTITPESGYQVSTLTVNGEDVKSQLTNGVLTISNVTANMTVEVTFELIPGYTENIKMTVPNGDRTAIGYSSSLGLDFTAIEDVKAWIVTGFTDDANVLLSRVRIVPPYTGLYLTSNVAGVEVDVPTTDKDIYYANLLKAAVEEETIQPTEMHDNVEFTNFVVGKLTSGEMGFVRVKTARTLGPNKSRLLVPSSYYPVANAAREFNVEFLDDDATTDIMGNEAVRQTANQLYDLQGRLISVSQARKGIYIYKGKKYVIK